MKQESQIAVAWGSPGGATAEISNAIEALTGSRPKPVRLEDLAGPNETVQVLMGNQDWILVAKAVAAIYGAELVKEAAKSTWKAAAPKFAQASDEVRGFFGRLISGIKQAIHARAPVILGIPRTPYGARRNIGVEILEGNTEEIARVVALLAEHGVEIEQKLDEWDSTRTLSHEILYDENSDCSVKLTVSDDGQIHMRAKIMDRQSKTSEVITYPLIEPLLKYDKSANVESERDTSQFS